MAAITIYVPSARTDLRQPTHIVVGELEPHDTVGRLHECVAAALRTAPAGAPRGGIAQRPRGELSRLIFPRNGPAGGEWQVFADHHQTVASAGISDGCELVWTPDADKRETNASTREVVAAPPPERSAGPSVSREWSSVRQRRVTGSPLRTRGPAGVMSPLAEPRGGPARWDGPEDAADDDGAEDYNDVRLPPPPGVSSHEGSPARSWRQSDEPQVRSSHQDRDRAPHNHRPMSPPTVRQPRLGGAGNDTSVTGRRVDSPPRSLISELRADNTYPAARPRGDGRDYTTTRGSSAADDSGVHDVSPAPAPRADRVTLSTGETLDVETAEELRLVRELEALRARRRHAAGNGPQVSATPVRRDWS